MKTIYTPELARIVKTEKITEKETFFEVELLERKSLNHKPGQFVGITVFGIGEAPISISSPNTPDKPTFELGVRAVGSVTKALSQMKTGDKIGVRGPFGNGFDSSEFIGQDLLFVAGGLGLVPLRSFIMTVLNNRKEYGRVMILYGSKTPKDILFKSQLDEWAKRKDIEFHMSVDLGDETWNGNVGVITTLLPLVKLAPGSTQAVIVGPPIMYRFVIAELKKRKIADENIWMSLERRMKCGVGKCGHCQMNGVYVCQEGPVFNYAKAKTIPEAI